MLLTAVGAEVRPGPFLQYADTNLMSEKSKQPTIYAYHLYLGLQYI